MKINEAGLWSLTILNFSATKNTSQVKSSQVNLIFRVAYVAQLLLGPLLQVVNVT